jgi:hypothetical protein
VDKGAGFRVGERWGIELLDLELMERGRGDSIFIPVFA